MGLNESTVHVLNRRADDEKVDTATAEAAGTDADGNAPKEDAKKLSTKLQKLILGLHSSHITDVGVDYAGIRKDPLFEEFVQESRLLAAADLSLLTKNELKAFFINLYNALTIHALVASGDALPESPIKVSKFWSSNAYEIGGHVYSLDDIEHGCLRGNHPHPTSKMVAFGKDDPRQQFVFELDPRVHFALVCGAKSCPAVRVYTAKNIERGLNAAALNFCDTEVTYHAEAGEVHLSQIFQWYGADFAKAGDERALVQALLAYKDVEADDNARALSEHVQSGAPFTVVYKKYDWSLNQRH